MNTSGSFSIRQVAVISLVLGLLAAAMPAMVCGAEKPAKKAVWIAIFSARECPRCRHVKEFTRALRGKYPVRIKVFDIDRASNYELFRKLEAIHGEQQFSVPLLMVGETILMGENAISDKLEPIVKRLARQGGSGLPYLGPRGMAKRATKGPAKAADRPAERCRECEKKGRPPSIGEELGKIKIFVDQVLDRGSSVPPPGK